MRFSKCRFPFLFQKKAIFTYVFIFDCNQCAFTLLTKEIHTSLADYSGVQIVALYLFVFAGIYFLSEAIRIVVRNVNIPHFKFLGVWLLLMLIPALFLLPFGTGRYMLPSLLPMVLILIADPDRDLNIGRKAISTIVVITFVFGLILSWTDFELALTYKVFPQSIRQNYPKEKIWFIGEWGFRYYMKEQGGIYLLSDDTSPSSGGVIIKPQMAGLHQMAESVSNQCLVTEPFDVFSPNPLRILNLAAKAGFYSSGFGLLPYSISRPLSKALTSAESSI